MALSWWASLQVRGPRLQRVIDGGEPLLGFGQDVADLNGVAWAGRR